MSANTYLDLDTGQPTLKQATDSSSGAGNAGDLVALDSAGKLNSNMMPSGIGADSATAEASETLAAGDLVNLWNDGGTVKARKADASSSGKEADGFVTGAVTSGNPAEVILDGTIPGLSGLTPGALYFLDTTAGGVSATAPSGLGNLVQQVGKAKSTTELIFEKGQHYLIG